MAIIAANIPNLLGESRISGYEDQIEAIGIRDHIALVLARGARPSRGRTSGRSRHAGIELVRYRDRASPKLAQACSAGENLGEVAITCFRTLETGTVPYFAYVLCECFVARVETETLDATAGALGPHHDDETDAAPSYHGMGAVVAALARARLDLKVAPRALFPVARGVARTRQIERVWLNPAVVRWTYTPYEHGVPGGAIEKAWNVQQGIEA